MILPSNRLLLFFGAMVLPSVAMGAIFPSTVLASVLLITIFIFSAMIDMAYAFKSLDGISTEFPEVIRMSKDREADIEFFVKNGTNKPKQLRIGLAFPQEIFSQNEILTLKLPECGKTYRFMWKCLPLKRGSYFFDKCYLESSSVLGLWDFRKPSLSKFELRVYPNLISEKKDISTLFLNKGYFGVHPQRQVGQGREFEKLREYIHGDNYDHIHWKATAKRGHPITKVFQIERTQEVYLIIDASRLSARTSNVMDVHETMLERFVTASLIIGIAAERQGDLFGIIAFADTVKKFIRAKNGRQHFNNCRDAIYALNPYTIMPDFNEVCSFIGMRLRRRALLVFFTNLDDPVIAGNFMENISILCKKHLVVTVMIKPSGIQQLFSGFIAESSDDIYKYLGGHILWHNLLELEKILQKYGVRFLLMDNEKVCSQLVSEYITIKQRQLL